MWDIMAVGMDGLFVLVDAGRPAASIPAGTAAPAAATHVIDVADPSPTCLLYTSDAADE